MECSCPSYVMQIPICMILVTRLYLLEYIPSLLYDASSLLQIPSYLIQIVSHMKQIPINIK